MLRIWPGVTKAVYCDICNFKCAMIADHVVVLRRDLLLYIRGGYRINVKCPRQGHRTCFWCIGLLQSRNAISPRTQHFFFFFFLLFPHFLLLLLLLILQFLLLFFFLFLFLFRRLHFLLLLLLIILLLLLNFLLLFLLLLLLFQVQGVLFSDNSRFHFQIWRWIFYTINCASGIAKHS